MERRGENPRGPTQGRSRTTCFSGRLSLLAGGGKGTGTPLQPHILSAYTLQEFAAGPHKIFSNRRTAESRPTGYRKWMRRGPQGAGVSVFIADDSEAVVERLAELLRDVPRAKLLGSAGDVDSAAESILRLNPEVVILDLHMPGGSGFDMLAKVKELKPLTKIIVLTNFPFPAYRDKCLKAGADFFLDKSTDFEKIPGIIGRLGRTPHDLGNPR
jgi:CheY-like chemotaxis protein